MRPKRRRNASEIGLRDVAEAQGKWAHAFRNAGLAGKTSVGPWLNGAACFKTQATLATQRGRPFGSFTTSRAGPPFDLAQPPASQFA
jgi:hypothetical protein